MTDYPDNTEGLPEGYPNAQSFQTVDIKPGEKMGNYVLREQVGVGGMGEVWLAEQEKPIKRKVAIKIIKLGMDSKEIVSRFEAERQALALMNHPNVAKVFEAGTTTKGRPYFVMEYVAGIPITSYCDKHKLGLQQRLKLFQQVCEGVQHAHQKAIIHRDLKPGNVLVAEQDNKLIPKIIDFGVAKATSHKLTEETVYTKLGVLIGTPEYMSPEQAELTGEGIDTRTDVYSLGVILYELLVGVKPFEPTELRKAGFDGIRKIIREQEPLRPSTKFTSLGNEASELAKIRKISVSKLGNLLSGDLDWITMKALEKDRVRRYLSPVDLSRDIERHLNNVPVDARPPTLSYRMGRYIRRHKASVVFSGIVTIIVIGSSISLAVLYSRAIDAEKKVAKEATTANQALDFMVGLFNGSDPHENGGKILTARDLLDKGASQLGDLKDQPEVQIQLMSTIGTIYKELGSYPQSFKILQSALDKQIEYAGENDLNTIDLYLQLGHNYVLVEDYDKGEEFLTLALNKNRELTGQKSIQTMNNLNALAFCYLRTSQYSRAESNARAALSILEENFPEEQLAQAQIMHTLGWSLFGLEQIDEAKDIFETSLLIRKNNAAYESPATAWTLNLLGWMLTEQEDESTIKKGINRLEEAVSLNRKLFDSSHVEICYNLGNMAKGYMKLEDYRTAAIKTQEAIEMGKRFLDEYGVIATNTRHLAYCYMKLKRYEEAEKLLLEQLSKLTIGDASEQNINETNEMLDSVYIAWGKPKKVNR